MNLIKSANDERYSEGQVWMYKTRQDEEASRIIIVKISKDLRSNKIFHLYIDKVCIKNPHSTKGINNFIGHVPVSEKTLNESCLDMVEIRKGKELPDITNAYKEWKNQKGGVFIVPLKEIVQGVEDIVRGN